MSIVLSEILPPETPYGEFIRMLLVGLAFLVIFGIAEAWHLLWEPPIEWTRKFVHVACGLVIACFHWIFSSDWPVIALGVAMILLMGVLRQRRWFKSIYGVPRRSFGDLYYLFSAVVLFIISHEHPIYYFISMLTLTISDALAAILGSTYQRIKYTVEHHHKSFEGSAVFFLSTFLIVQIPLLLLTDTDRLHCILIGLEVAFLVTCLEAICLNGLDNLLVPFGTYYLLYKFSLLNSPIITHLLFWQVTILGITALIAWKSRLLTLSGAIAVQLFLFGAFTLGDPIWLIPPLIALGVLMIVFAFLHHKARLPSTKIYQVVAVFYITLIPALIVLAHNIFEKYPNLPDFLTNKNGFYPLYIGAISCQLAIALFRFFYLYSGRYHDEWSWKSLAFVTLCSIIIIIPFGLWVQTGTLNWLDFTFTTTIAIIGPAIYGFVRHWKNAFVFPWEFRIQMISTAIAVLMTLPFYISFGR